MPAAPPDVLKLRALEQFAAQGFEGASLQRIALDAGYSKSSVLYHFDSKEALFDAALRPAVAAMAELVAAAPAPGVTADRRAFVIEFVDFLFEHRLAVAVIVNHGLALRGTPVIDEADGLSRALSARLQGRDDLDTIRFGVAMAGAAFVLVAADRWSDRRLPEHEVKRMLTAVLQELVSPAAPTPDGIARADHAVVA